METVSTQDVQQMKQKGNGPAIINVLDEQYFRKEHIPGSENIPVSADDFVQQVAQRVDSKTKPVIVYCANTECDASPKAAKLLDENGFENVYDYEGGMDAWKEAGLKVESAT